jgi:hypothetical protein
MGNVKALSVPCKRSGHGYLGRTQTTKMLSLCVDKGRGTTVPSGGPAVRSPG